MKHTCIVISVADIHAARRFYEDLFGLELYQDYGRNISFTCGLALQEDFDWLVNLPKESIGKKSNNMEICFEEQDLGQRVVRFYDPDGHMIEVGEDMKMVINRFLTSGMSMDEVSVKMGASIEDLNKLLEH